MNILVVGTGEHGWIVCPECSTEQYRVQRRTFKKEDVVIDHETKMIHINPSVTV